MSTGTAGAGALRARLSGIIAGLEWFSSAMLIVMMVLTFIDVVGRYIFSQPVFGASEVLSATLALIVFSGLGITNARDDHIVVELLDSHVRRAMGGAYDIMIQSFSILAMTLIAYVLWLAAIEAWHHDSRTYVLEIPTWTTVGAISALASLSVVSQIAGVVLMFRAPDRQRGV